MSRAGPNGIGSARMMWGLLAERDQSGPGTPHPRLTRCVQ
ncbi:hypothetical protein FRUB_08985 [Fimbriiglobus ruber]|uniref:Uncharacterized protein n=1 Tax=Fimbriiglobus ruber TaxID=1908690 RepID=A0A225D4K0_9BACT|nr:hypothetical protein FRUB_08985 [Fimbriiglobus ruber]